MTKQGRFFSEQAFSRYNGSSTAAAAAAAVAVVVAASAENISTMNKCPPFIFWETPLVYVLKTVTADASSTLKETLFFWRRQNDKLTFARKYVQQ